MVNSDFSSRVLAIVDQVPLGMVATYGQVARLAGYPRNARQVGHILRGLPPSSHYPCHRIVTTTGRLVPGWIDQGPLLKSEGVPFKDPDHVAIKSCQWDGRTNK